MTRHFIAALLLAASTAAPALAQQPVLQAPRGLDLGLAYTYLRTNIVPGCNCVGLNGGSLEASYPLTPHLAVLADFTLAHAASITPDGYSLTQFTYTFGARYYLTTRRLRPFAEALVGAAHTSGTLAPANAGTGPTNNSFALQLGGGLTYRLSRRLSLRPIQADYLMTTLSNNAADRQNDLRLSTGVNFRFGR